LRRLKHRSTTWAPIALLVKHLECSGNTVSETLATTWSGILALCLVELRGFEPLTLACHRGIPATAARDLGAWNGRGPLGRRRRRLISAALGLLDLGVDVGTEPGESEIRAGGELVPFGGQVDGEVLLDDGG
jgi:hypothetical protein